MSSTPKKMSFKLPRLKTKEELLKSSPELFNKLLGEDLGSARSTSAHYAAAKSPTKAAALASPVRKLQTSGTMMDTPRFDEQVITEEMQVAKELESAKSEQEKLKAQLKKVKEEAGSTGGEAQQLYIKQLMQELELKKGCLNKLWEETRAGEDRIARLRDDDVDCARLTPGGLEEEQRYIAELKREMARVEEELAEAEAKNRLCFLLGERTRREHLASDMRVRSAQETKEACLEDLAVLAAHLNDKRQEREAAEREAARLRQMLEETKLDNQKKLRERRKEVRELKRRQQRDREKEQQRHEKELEAERQRREKAAQQKVEQEAYEQQVAALAPKIEALQVVWNRVRAISGADTPEEVLAYWNGLKSKQRAMQDLVRLAEQREAAAKADMAALQPTKAAIFVEVQDGEAAAAGEQVGDDAAEATEAEAAVEAADNEGGQGQQQDEGLPAKQPLSITTASPAVRPLSAAPSPQVVEAKRAEALRAKYSKLRSVCISAEQGLQALLQRLQVALQEVPPDSPSTAKAGGDTRRSKESGAQQGGGAAPPRDVRSPGSLRGGRAGSETGSAGRPGMPSAARLRAGPCLRDMPHSPSGRASPAGLQPQLETASEGAGSAEEVGQTGIIGSSFSRGGAGGSGAEDDVALPHLGEVLAMVSERLAKLQATVGSPAVESGEPQPAAEDCSISGSARALMRGLVRRTWTGAPWLDSLASGSLDLTKLPTMRRQKGKKKEGVQGPDLSRIMGYTSEAPGGADAAAADSDGASSDEDDGVVGRDYIKMRAAKMAARHHAQKMRGE